MGITTFARKIKTHIRNKRIESGSEKWIKRYKKADQRYLKRRYDRVKNIPIDPNLIFFESFLGRNVADSPFAIFREIENDPAYAGYHFVWSVNDVKKNAFLSTNPRVRVVKRLSEDYYASIATAKYVINNITNNILAPKKEGQIYIQTWHGTPLKRLGIDIELDGNGLKSREEIHEQYRKEADTFDYLLSPSAYTSEKLSSAFGLSEEERKNKVIELGYPRNSALFTFTEDEKAALRSKYGIPEGKKVILYCTTWREQTYKEGEGFKYEIELDVENLYRKFGDTACVVMRMHYNHKATKIDFDAYKGFLINGTLVDEINDLFIIADLLITDYSSVMFDFANLKRPMIFYMYDRDRYENEIRGFYFDASKLPGPIVTKQSELEEKIGEFLTEKFIPDEKYIAFCNKFTYLDDANATRRVVDRLLPAKTTPDPESRQLKNFWIKVEKKEKRRLKIEKIKKKKAIRILTIPIKVVGFVMEGIEKLVFNPKYNVGSKYAHIYNTTRVKDKTVLYESFFGRGLLCNPFALFNEALNDERMRDYKHIWSIDDPKDLEALRKKYRHEPRVSFVRKNTPEYMRALSSAKFLINNASFPYYFTKKKEQVYVNTWHGIPLKSLGYDMPNGKTESSNVVRNMLISDYMISASPFLTQIYEESYKLKEVYTGKIIEEGYPRLDTLERFKREDVLKLLADRGVKVDPSKKIILYAPTWKGKSYATASADVSGLFEFKKRFESVIDTNEYQVLIKPHQRVFQLAANKLREGFFVPADVEANIVLSVTDVLVSDFSSIFYDYLYTGRPVVFYIEDLEAYNRERGLYHRVEEALPGPSFDTPEKAADFVNRLETEKIKWQRKYDEIRKYANADVKPGISKRIIDIVFFDREDGYNVKKVASNKKRLLISRGRLGVNGITTALINILNLIDHEKYDVTLMIEKGPEDLKNNVIESINPNVRVIYRTLMPPMSASEGFVYKLKRKFGFKNQSSKGIEREWYRNFGDTTFDTAVDFSGYIYMNSLLMAVAKAKKKCIWLHNDMMAEFKLKHDELLEIFRLYRYFDHVVACGSEIMRVNAKHIPPKYDVASRIVCAGNTIDYNRILSMAEENPMLVINDIDAETGEKMFNFLTIGRMSPEKNHIALIKAFKRFHDIHPNSALYMLGDGQLRGKLNELVAELGIYKNVIMPGNVANPYSLLKRCGCFVLPSVYEGLPMTVNEARVLKKPIIMSDFSSVNDCCVEDGQIVIGNKVDDIFKGMEMFASGKVPSDYVFEADKYNQEKVTEFYKAVFLE